MRPLRMLVLVLLAAAVPASFAPAAATPLQQVAPSDSTEVDTQLGDDIAAIRTRTTRTYAQPDLSNVLRASSSSVHFADSHGRWRAVDNALVASTESGVAFTNAANRFRLRLPASLSDPIRLAFRGHELALQIVGAAGTLEVEGSTATYRDALPGVDVSYAVHSDMIKETILLKSPSGQREYEIRVTPSAGLSPKTVGKALRWLHGDGTTVSFDRPFLFDSAGEGRGSNAASFSWEKQGGDYVVTLRIDDAWLDAPDRAWPVSLDPTISVELHQDCTLASGSQADTTFCLANALEVGQGSNTKRALVGFDLDNAVPPGSQVTSASLNLYLSGRTNTTPVSASLHQVTQGWDASVSWNKRDGVMAWSSPGGTYLTSPQDTRSVTALGWHSWSLPDLVQGWLDGSITNRGVILKATDEALTTNMLQFRSGDSADPALYPYLEVTYQAPDGGVEGTVVEHATGSPISGATVSLPDLGVSTTSDQQGNFSLAGSFTATAPFRAIQAQVTKAGYGAWSTEGMPLYPGDTLIITAELRSQPWSHTVGEEPLQTRTAEEVSAGGTCTGWNYYLVPPEKIWVWITTEGARKQVVFEDYLKHVLPSEWPSYFEEDSLRAGAMAAKTYAWFRTLDGQSRTSGSNCYDILDTTSDQVYDPTFTTARTNQAVNATFGTVMRKNNAIFMAQYVDGTYTCAPITSGPYAGRMSQNGTRACADQGMAWPDIVKVYYPTIVYSYLRNLLLNPDLENAPTYMWKKGATTTMLRANGVGYNGSAYYLVVSAPSGNAQIYQERSFQVGAGTPFESDVSLRCGPANTAACSVTLKIAAVAKNGAITDAIKVISVPNDNLWRRYAFDAAPANSSHPKVRYTVMSPDQINVDLAWLERG